jgi:thiol-disulfide isomerase/thioredoxin
MSPTRAPRRHAAALAGAVAAAVVLSACSATSGGSATDGANFVSGSGQITVLKPADRKPAPELSGETITGGHADLADYRGKVVVINVWGSWCDPCRAEAPNLVAVAAADKGKGVEFLGINTRDLTESNAVRFADRFGITYPNLFDPYGKLILRFPKGSLNPQSLPGTLVIDRRGRVAARALKPLGEGELNDLIDPVVAEK